MKCQRCGADIPKGEVFCFECGEEVQLVPDYNSLEYMIQQKQALDEIELRKEQELQRKRERQEKREAELKKRKRRRIVLVTVFLIIFMSIMVLGVIAFVRYQQEHSFEYQYSNAYNAYIEEDYTTAEEYAGRALALSPNNDNAILLMAEIKIHNQEIASAAELLKTYIKKYPDSVDAYARLISIYEENSRYEEIKLLMNECSNEIILTQFAAYISTEPSFVTQPGEYTSKTSVEIAAASGTVYYTTDGTDPSVDSSIYTEPIVLEEGTTMIKAVVYSEAGIAGKVCEAEYTVTYPRPNSPFISPASGEYDAGTQITVIVPDGCKAYYAFDSIANRFGNLYDEPVTMPDGEHIFSVILVNENGKESYPASETYIVG